MAKVSNPLMSVMASGKFGPIVYGRHGIARPYVIPINPRTSEQGKTRLYFKSTQKAIAALGTAGRDKVRSVYGQTTWNAMLVGAVVGEHLQSFTDSLTAWGTESPATQDLFNNMAAANDITTTTIEYTPEIVTGAQALYALYRAFNAEIQPGTKISEFNQLLVNPT